MAMGDGRGRADYNYPHPSPPPDVHIQHPGAALGPMEKALCLGDIFVFVCVCVNVCVCVERVPHQVPGTSS